MLKINNKAENHIVFIRSTENADKLMRSQENNKKLKSGIGGGFFVPESSSEVLGSGNEGRHGRRMDEGAHQRSVS